MLDFSDKELYRDRKKDMDKFLDQVLITATDKEHLDEDEANISVSDAELVDMMGANGVSSDNVAVRGGEDESVNVTSVGGVAENITKERGEDDRVPEYEKGHDLLNILVAPLYMFKYMFLNIKDRLKDEQNLHRFVSSLIRVSAITTLISLFMWLVVDGRYWFNPVLQTVFSFLMLIISSGLLYLIKHPDYLDKYRSEEYLAEKAKKGSLEQAEDEVSGLYEDVGMEDLEDYLEGEEEKGEYEVSSDELEEFLEEPDREGRLAMSSRSGGKSPIAGSPIVAGNTLNEFIDGLGKVYRKNLEEYRGVIIRDREEMVKSFASYLVPNDPGFSEFTDIEELSATYKNVMFTLYLGLKNINNSFPAERDGKTERIVANSLTENSTMFKVELELPNSFKEDQLKSRLHVFETLMKHSEQDNDVMLTITKYRKGYVFKIFKESKGVISLGDVLRYRNDNLKTQVFEQFVSKKAHIPIVIGVQGNEFPFMFDLGMNTSAVVAGESGSGKSWGVFLMMFNMVISNTHNDINFIVLDKKRTAFWKEFANFPHVVGFHYKVHEYFDIFQEILDEMEHRKKMMEVAGAENIRSYRKTLRDQENYEELKYFPWLIVVVDEVSNTLKELAMYGEEEGEDLVKKFDNLMTSIAQEGRSLGIKLVVIGQRTIAEAMPKNTMNNATLKVGFKLSAPDFEKLMGEDVRGIKLPRQKGQAVVRDDESGKPLNVRTLGVGGIEDEEIMNLIRLVAYDWMNRTRYDEFYKPPGLDFVYNLPERRKRALKKISSGDVFVGVETAESSANKMELFKRLAAGEEVDLNKELDEYEEEDGDVVDVDDFRTEGEIESEVEGEIESEIESEVESEVEEKRDRVKGSEGVSDDKDVDEFWEMMSRREAEEKEKETETIIKDSDSVKGRGSEQVNEESEGLGDFELEEAEWEAEPAEPAETTEKSEEVGEREVASIDLESLLAGEDEVNDRKVETYKENSVNIGKEGDNEVEKESREIVRPAKVKDFIKKYGEGKGAKRLRKSVVNEFYSGDEIRKALNEVEIIEYGDHYEA